MRSRYSQKNNRKYVIFGIIAVLGLAFFLLSKDVENKQSIRVIDLTGKLTKR